MWSKADGRENSQNYKMVRFNSVCLKTDDTGAHST
jgi:hypothetical protein